ncbi:Cytochrome c-type biogenesis protein CcmH/NrfF [Nitrosomonas sp. Nm51]|uniref:cytochrome c-type biogenesis protein n=1 Tax=Nitrosomonas sp. Nm51 TaxID=133720 RepID=UPI0008B72AE7|nr:cytochrome c-type biogenesis protein [Nitrosomonas sp. Nm51]SEQ76033.1 Cytochrome c-type biogenesis protein CcmH/NrfF [Nitrosomonas sp. Nm51]
MKKFLVSFLYNSVRVCADGITLKRFSDVFFSSTAVMLVILFVMPSQSLAETEYKEAVPVAENPEIEKRMLALTEDLRCLVCQNESIAESRADFSNDMRRIIREQIKANKTDDEIIDFLVDRYGDFVLYNPPMKATTVLLWFGPLVFFILSTWFLVKFLKGRRQEIKEVTLSEAELKKAAVLLDESHAKVSGNQHKENDNLNERDNSSTRKQHQKTDVSVRENKGNNV